MRLNLLSIEGNRAYEKRNDVVPIRARTHYLTEQFLYYLPKMDLDGSGKLVICFEEKPEDKERYMCDEYFHVSVYYVDKNVLERFESLEQDAFGEYFLGIIVDVCSDIARFHHKEETLIEQIREAANKIRANRFELVIQQKKLSKVSDDRRLKAKVFRQLNFLGEIWYIEVENKNTKYVVRYELMEQYTNISKVDFYKKASWEGSQFVLRDRLDRETARIETQQ